MTENRKASAVLRDALQYIKTNGWAQGELGYVGPGETKYPSCALGAVAAAGNLTLPADGEISAETFVVRNSRAASRALARVLPAEYRPDLRRAERVASTIIDYNDTVISTRYEAHEWFERAIEIAEKAEAKAGAR